MKRVDGINGKKFLVGVLFVYFFTFFFSYFYFMTASTIIVGNAIVNLPEENNSPEIIDPYLIKTFTILGVLIAIIIIVYVIPKILYKKHSGSPKKEIPVYKPFRNFSNL